jgi:site-specific DNA-cytosine methylase
MNILVACEYSGVVREAFKKKGHNAWSCDLLDAEDGSVFHKKQDCMVAIAEGWDIIIMHPPCTHLAVSGNRWYGTGMPGHDKRVEAAQWTLQLWRLAKQYSPKVCMENPVGVLSNYGELPKPQYIQPWMFGHGETKKTGLWLYNLPYLVPTDVVEGREQRVWKMAPSEDRWKERSRTFTGIGEAMATQWG